MEKNAFSRRVIYMLIPAILLSGGLLKAQSDAGMDTEVIQALERLDRMTDSFENSLIYKAQTGDVYVEVEYALERLEQFASEVEKNLAYKAPAYTDDILNHLMPDNDLQPPVEYLTDIAMLSIRMTIH